ncbi:phage baseplate protein [Dryocola clanedunensis]|uniref:phage baseplate protein n=1 Tax=Cedecea sulfonylureivorans TaxID=3051154 RepID=UPI001926327B|nr:hypothetical protein [Cedecea sulfonylureivorans]
MASISALFQQSAHQIGFLIPKVVINEAHSDTLEIASHPIEYGGSISDHAWKSASSLVIDCCFADDDLRDFAGAGVLFGSANALGQDKIYQQLLDLQRSCEPFDVITTRRTYSNMLLKQIDVTTKNGLENILSCRLTLSQIQLARTEAIPTAKKADMKEGVSTSGVSNGGTRNPVPVVSATVIPIT